MTDTVKDKKLAYQEKLIADRLDEKMKQTGFIFHEDIEVLMIACNIPVTTYKNSKRLRRITDRVRRLNILECFENRAKYVEYMQK